MLNQIELRIKDYFDCISKLCKGRYWILTTVLLAFILSIFMSFPDRDIYSSKKNSEFMDVYKKSQTPFKQIDFAPDSHSAKLSFRITVPVVINILRLNVVAITIMEYLFGLLFLYVITRLTYDLTSNKAYAFLTTISIGLIYAGTTSFVESRGTFDGIAITLIILALAFRNPLLIMFSVFFAGFTDERALVASALVIVYHLKVSEYNIPSLIKSCFTNSKCLAVIAAWFLYAIVRICLTFFCGLETDVGGVGFYLVAEQIKYFLPGLWTGLEGFWILIIFALVFLLKKRRYAYAFLYFAAIAAISVTAMSVMDITRSMSYLLPAIFVGIKIMCSKDMMPDRFFMNMLFIIFLICLAWPNYYICGNSFFIWAPPLPVRIFLISY